MALCRGLWRWPATPFLFTASPRRTFSVRLLDSLEQEVSDASERLMGRAIFQDERMVTESRRPLERIRSSPETLEERLAAQRSIRRYLIPSDVKVDKSKMYIEFTWPPEAVEAGARLERAEAAWRARQRESEGTAADTAAGEPKKLDNATQIEPTAQARQPQAAPKPWVRTRALAEYLRAYTSSSDGPYTMAKYPVYGRRGITITDVYPMGNYALRLSFSDGHTGGLYSYEYLYYLTSPGNKYRLMRSYLANLRQHRKSRDPPKRAPSKKWNTKLGGSATGGRTA